MFRENAQQGDQELLKSAVMKNEGALELAKAVVRDRPMKYFEPLANDGSILKMVFYQQDINERIRLIIYFLTSELQVKGRFLNEAIRFTCICLRNVLVNLKCIAAGGHLGFQVLFREIYHLIFEKMVRLCTALVAPRLNFANELDTD